MPSIFTHWQEPQNNSKRNYHSNYYRTKLPSSMHVTYWRLIKNDKLSTLGNDSIMASSQISRHLRVFEIACQWNKVCFWRYVWCRVASHTYHYADRMMWNQGTMPTTCIFHFQTASKAAYDSAKTARPIQQARLH